MNAQEAWLLAYLSNALWQIPLLFAVAWLAAKVLRDAGAQVVHRVWVMALVLQALLPAVSFARWHWPAELLLRTHADPQGGQVTIVFGPGEVVEGLALPLWAVHAFTFSYAVCLCFFAARLMAALWRLAGLRKRATTMSVDEQRPGSVWESCRTYAGVQDVELAISEEVFGPAAIGIRRRLILLPPALLEQSSEEDLRVVLTHELVHIERRDFAWNLLYELLSLPVRFHPVVGMTRHRMVESREILCDQLAAKAARRNDPDVDHNHAAYAKSLLRLSALLLERAQTKQSHAIGMFDANVLERRMNMLTRKQVSITRVRKAALIAMCAMAAFGACSSALALRINLAQQASSPGAAQTTPEGSPKKVASGVLAGRLISRVAPMYPAAAKEAGIEGSVVLHAIISRDGTIESLTVITGPPELRESAVDAVKQWVYQPYVLNGNPVEVDTTITVNYALAH